MEGKSLKQLLFDLNLGLIPRINVEFKSNTELVEFLNKEFNENLDKYNFHKCIMIDSKTIVPLINHNEVRYLIFMKGDNKINIFPTCYDTFNDYIYINGKFFID